MAKSPSKPKKEFMAERRAAIAELASRRRRQQILRAAGVNVDRKDKVISPAVLTGSPPPPPSQR